MVLFVNSVWDTKQFSENNSLVFWKDNIPVGNYFQGYIEIPEILKASKFFIAITNNQILLMCKYPCSKIHSHFSTSELICLQQIQSTIDSHIRGSYDPKTVKYATVNILMLCVVETLTDTLLTSKNMLTSFFLFISAFHVMKIKKQLRVQFLQKLCSTMCSAVYAKFIMICNHNLILLTTWIYIQYICFAYKARTWYVLKVLWTQHMYHDTLGPCAQVK